MIILKLKRDDARFIEEKWLPFMIAVAKTKLRDTEIIETDYLNWKLMHAQLQELHMMFKKKLLSSPVKLKLKFSDANGITLYKFLMAQPISEEELYYVNMRQQLCNVLHQQFYETA
jgi:hypothetical protein